MFPDSHDHLVARARIARVREDGRVDLEWTAGSDCGACRGACFMLPVRTADGLSLPHGAGCSPGDAVEIALPASRLLALATVTYGTPLAGLLAGAVAGHVLGASDLGCLAGALAGGALVLSALARVRTRLERTVLDALMLRAS